MKDTFSKNSKKDTEIHSYNDFFYNEEHKVEVCIRLTGHQNGQLHWTIFGLGNLDNEDEKLIETHIEALKALILKSIKLKPNIKSSTKKKKNV